MKPKYIKGIHQPSGCLQTFQMVGINWHNSCWGIILYGRIIAFSKPAQFMYESACYYYCEYKSTSKNRSTRWRILLFATAQKIIIIIVHVILCVYNKRNTRVSGIYTEILYVGEIIHTLRINFYISPVENTMYNNATIQSFFATFLLNIMLDTWEYV